MSTFTFRGLNIYYDYQGDQQETLLILNGIMMSTESWTPFMSEWLKDFSVLRLDFIDQGQSDQLKEPYQQDIQVELLKALLDHLSLKKVYLVGISYGGSIALQFAVKYQTYLAKMILLNAAAWTTPWLRDVGRGWNAVANTRVAEAYYHITIPYIYSPHFYNNHQAWMEARKNKLLEIFSNARFLDAMIRLTNSAESHDVKANLKNIKTPTLVVSSDFDFLTPKDEQTYIVERMPNAVHCTFENTGHASMYEKPELFMTTIRGFFKTKSTQIEL